jgi:DtxR family transcriptional regulator, Mn-dependent transcriptional regulator
MLDESASHVRGAAEPWRPVEHRAVQDTLRALLECEHRRHEAGDALLSALSGLSREHTLRALAAARQTGWAEEGADGWRLTADGRVRAVQVMRAHRLTETDLARNSGLPAVKWHASASSAEHLLSTEEINALADRLGNPRFDPHGDPIPTREGLFPEAIDQPLSSWPADQPGVIAHIEDEPPRLFARLADRGIFAGMRFRRRSEETREGEVRLVIEGRDEILPVELAGLIRVCAPTAGESPTPDAALRLSALARGCSATVLGLLSGCIGSERSRMLDLGFVPGSVVTPELASPLHGPVAYRVRGTLIALRGSQAAQVLVQPSV